MLDCIIIGSGVVGAATAYELARYNLKTLLIDKENDVAMGATRANSAIIHAGYDPEPGTDMARLNVQGSKMAKEICAKLDVPYSQIGSFVLAFDEDDLKTIEKLYDNGLKNGVEGIAILSKVKALELEPNLSDEVKGVLYAPTGAIISPWEYTLAMACCAVENGVEFKRNTACLAIEKIEGGYKVITNNGTFETKTVVNAAGINSGKVHDMVLPHEFTIKADKGEYYLLDKSEGTRVNRVIFQCPSKVGKGVLVSPTVHGNLIVGPNAQEIEDGEDTSITASALTFVANTARRSVPNVNFRESIRNFAGVRALSTKSDFIIARNEGFVDLAGIKSPGLSSAPAIAVEARKLLAEAGLDLQANPNFKDERKVVRFKHLSPEEKQAVIEKDPLYGRVICRCETITEGEIVSSIHTAIPPLSVDGVKRRAGAGMGRCQGGFCGPRVLDILSRELEIDKTAVLQDGVGSEILTGKTKNGGAN